MEAIEECTSLHEIVIPDAVKTIEEGEFRYSSGFTTVTLGEGLEEIREEAIEGFTSLQRMVTPNSVKTIKDGALSLCVVLTTGTLGDVLKG